MLAHDVRGNDARLRLIQNQLIDIVDILDPEARRVPVGLRKRVSPTAWAPANTGTEWSDGECSE